MYESTKNNLVNFITLGIVTSLTTEMEVNVNHELHAQTIWSDNYTSSCY